MGNLLVKTQIDSFTQIKDIDIFLDNISDNKEFLSFKITTPKFQQILTMHKNDWFKFVRDTTKTLEKENISDWVNNEED